MQKKIVSFDSAATNPDLPIVRDIDAVELHGRRDEVHLIDVRPHDEFTGELGHIPGARMVVLHSLPEHLDDLPRDATVVFVCRSGARSARATAFATSQGFEHVYNLKGGMIQWNALDYEIEGKN